MTIKTTIREYLEQLPEPARTRARNNAAPLMLDKSIDSRKSALIVAFFWENSPEGYAYWQGVFNSLKD